MTKTKWIFLIEDRTIAEMVTAMLWQQKFGNNGNGEIDNSKSANILLSIQY